MSYEDKKGLSTRFRKPAEALREITDVMTNRGIRRMPPPRDSIPANQFAVCCYGPERVDDLTLLAIAEKHQVTIEVECKQGSSPSRCAIFVSHIHHDARLVHRG